MSRYYVVKIGEATYLAQGNIRKTALSSALSRHMKSTGLAAQYVSRNMTIGPIDFSDGSRVFYRIRPATDEDIATLKGQTP